VHDKGSPLVKHVQASGGRLLCLVPKAACDMCSLGVSCGDLAGPKNKKMGSRAIANIE
jgi:hypothetical protein